MADELPLDLALIGVPKAGTSSIFGALEKHPEVRGTRPKETFFFLDEEHPLHGSAGANVQAGGTNALADLYRDDRRQSQSVRMEGTTQHVYAQTALRHFRDAAHVKLVLALREPAARIRSLYRYVAEHQCNLEGVSFPVYVDQLVAGRMEAIRDHFLNHSAFLALRDALTHSDYGYWLDQWYPALEQGRLYIVLFEAYQSQPEASLKALARWLGIDPSFYDGFRPEHANPTHSNRFRSIHRFVRPRAARLPDTLKPGWLVGLYRRLQAAPPRRDSDEEQAMARLRHHFAPMTERLRQEYGLPVDELWYPQAPRS